MCGTELQEATKRLHTKCLIAGKVVIMLKDIQQRGQRQHKQNANASVIYLDTAIFLCAREKQTQI